VSAAASLRPANALTVVDAELNIARLGDGEQVEHEVRRATNDGVHHEAIEEGLTRQNVSRLEIQRKEVAHGRAGPQALGSLCWVRGWCRCRSL